MKLLLKENKILLFILILSILVSFVTIGGRIGVETKNKSYDIVLDYNEIKAMADQSEHDVSWWLKQFKDMGITKVGLAEENMVSLMEGTDLPINATIMDIITREADWEANYPEAFIQGLYDHGFDRYDLLIESASKETFDFVANAVKERYQPDRYFISPAEDGGFIVLDGTAKETLYSEKYKYLNSMKKGFVEKDEIVSSKLMYLNFGLLDSKTKIVKDAGMEIIPRTASYDGWNDTNYAKAVIASYQELGKVPEYMIVGGESVIGWDDGIDVAKDYITENNITIGLIENTTQLQNILQYGVNDIVKSTGYDAVRIFSVWDYIQNRYQYYGYAGAKEIENTLFRAVVERNVRLIYFKPIKEYKDQHVYVTDVEEYKTMFSNLETRLAKHDIKFGQASVMENYQVSFWEKLAMVIGCIAAAVLIIDALLAIGKKYKWLLFILGTLGVIGFYTVLPGYAEHLAAFAAAVMFPCMGILLIVKQSKEFGDMEEPSVKLVKIISKGIILLICGVAISLLGGVMTAAPISSANFMLEIDIFRGVKLAQLLPLAFYLVVYLAYYGYRTGKKNPGRLEFHDIRDVLYTDIKVWMILLAMVLGGVGYYYLIRTGHDSSIEVSNLEMIFRNMLEDHLTARPRNKEFLFAFPSILLLVYTTVKRLPLWPIIFGLASVIGLTSVVNTFMHIRTPLYLGFVRTGYSLLFGILVGIVAVVLFDVAYQLYKKLERQISKNV